ncbi:hypothetical protein EPN87_03215 [archaeon]|nr:MAG: hypothetical protein EPN87_03215 [archaeon]
MDLRNIQKSGNAYYMYLPAAWCRQNNITNNSHVAVDMSSEGSLTISPHADKKTAKALALTMQGSSKNVINKFVVASYLNPVRSFRMQLDKKMSSLDILDHKKLLAGVEIVEFGDDYVSCESVITVDDPDVLLKTMIRKMLSMIRIMQEGHLELVNRYEEEIDRSNMMITKSAISSLMFKRSSSLKHIDLFYIALLSKNLESIADNLSKLKKEKNLLNNLSELIGKLLATLESLDMKSATSFINDTYKIINQLKRDDLQHFKVNLDQICEIIADWVITHEIEKQKTI